MLEPNTDSDEETDVCMAKWVDAPKSRPMVCAFLKPSPGKREEMKYTFDVSKCDKLFDILLQNNIIRLREGHVIPPPEQLAKKDYCKWHNSFSHSTNECNYFRRQIQSALADGRLTFGEASKMKLDKDPFPINVIDFEGKRVLVRTDQAETTKGKNVVISDDLKLKMIIPMSPEVGVWKVNERKRFSLSLNQLQNFCSTNILHNGKEMSSNILEVSRDPGLQKARRQPLWIEGRVTELEK